MSNFKTYAVEFIDRGKEFGSQLRVNTFLDNISGLFVKENLVNVFLKTIPILIPFVARILVFSRLILFLRLCGHLFSNLFRVILSHRLGVHGEAQSVKVETGLSMRSDSGVAIFTPVVSPGIFNYPGGAAIWRCLPSNNFEYSIALEFEGLSSARVDTWAVSQQVSVWVKLSDDGAVR